MPRSRRPPCNGNRLSLTEAVVLLVVAVLVVLLTKTLGIDLRVK